jgi:hypothetical protein
MKAMGPDNAIISDCSNQQAWFIHKAAIRAIFQPESAIFITSIISSPASVSDWYLSRNRSNIQYKMRHPVLNMAWI